MAIGQAAHRLLRTALLLCACSIPPAIAQTALELDPGRGVVPLHSAGQAWLDDTGEATAAQVAAQEPSAWTPTNEDHIYRLSTGKSLWIHFILAPAPHSDRWYLEVPYPSVNSAALYTYSPQDGWVAQVAGDHIAVANWPVPQRHPVLPVLTSAEAPRTYLLQVKNSHTFSAPLRFVTESHLSRREQQTSLILGMYFGLVALAGLLAALSAVSLRDSAYGWYSVTVLTMGLTQAALTGIAGLHLWPLFPGWTDLAPLVLPVLALGALTWFVALVTSVPERSRRLGRFTGAFSLASLAIAAAIALAEPALRFLLLLSYVVPAPLLGLYTVVWAIRRGDRYAPWLLAGMIPVCIGAAFPIARTAGLVPLNLWTVHAMQIGIAVEFPILLLMLMLRSQDRREQQRRLQGLPRFDPATGLINRLVFVERLGRLIPRSIRLNHTSAVLLVDIANLPQIRRDFDRRAAAELPVRIAARLMSSVREIDSVARLSEQRFGILLEGPLTPEQVAEAGPKFLARCLMPFAERPLGWVAQPRVAMALVPADGTNAEAVLEQLDRLLSTVPAESKRAIFTLAKPLAAATS